MIGFPKFGAVSGSLYTFDLYASMRAAEAFDEAVYPSGPTFAINGRALRAKVCSNTLNEVGMSGGFVEEFLR